MKTPFNVFEIGMAGSADGGGLERYYFELVRALPGVGVQPAGLVVAKPDGSHDGAPFVSAFARDGDSMLRRWSRMRSLSADRIRNADVLASHFAPYVFPILDRVRERPFVVHFHGPWALESRANGTARSKVIVRSAIERAVYAFGHRFITLSRAFANILVRQYGVAEDRIRIVRGGVDLARFRIGVSRREARERLGWPRDRRTIVTVRRLVPSKGIEGLIEASVALRRADPTALLQIVGTGPLAADLQRLIEERGLEDTVRLAGRATDEELILAYRAADVSIVPSVAYEGFGLVVIESLACGTPALVTDVGGLPEVVRELDGALVLGGSDADAIALGLASVATGELVLPSEDACLRYAERFDWPIVAAEVRDVYAEALR